MPSVFGHSLAAWAFKNAVFPKKYDWKLVVLACACACAPDLDMLAFQFGIPYLSQWGHRGWTHSIVFSIAFGWLISWIFYRKSADFQRITVLLIVSTLSHGLLDMCTNMGRGIALFWPFSQERHFFGWRPIHCSPLSIYDFRGEWAMKVLASEVIYIGLPSMAIVLFSKFFKK
jgi:inner membrane protein